MDGVSFLARLPQALLHLQYPLHMARLLLYRQRGKTTTKMNGKRTTTTRTIGRSKTNRTSFQHY
jgi:hypothetical protein